MDKNQSNQDSINIVDVRTPGEFFSGHCEGAINIPLNEIMGNLELLSALKGKIILCCASGARSGSAVHTLQQQGFTNVQNGGPWYEVQNTMTSLVNVNGK